MSSLQNNDLNTRMVKNTFYATYVFLLTTATITFIEAMRTKVPKIRHILNLETCISVVAAYFYGKFMDKINESDSIDYEEINKLRYTDWAITTPIMLLVLLLALLFNIKKKNSGPSGLSFYTFVIVLAMNFFMLGAGYMGEVGMIDKTKGMLAGFVGFFALFGYIYQKYIKPHKIFDNSILFWAFFVFWIGYGLLYMSDDVTRNVGYNVLDLFAKCFVGIFFWAYFTKTFHL